MSHKNYRREDTSKGIKTCELCFETCKTVQTVNDPVAEFNGEIVKITVCPHCLTELKENISA